MAGKRNLGMVGRSCSSKRASGVTPERQLNPISFSDLLAKDLPPRELILSPWLPKQGLAMIYAERGIGKTFVALGIGYAVSTGQKFLSWQAPAPRGVLHLDGEMPAIVLKERLQQIKAGNGGINPIAPYILITPDFQEYGMPDLATTEGQSLIEPFITSEIELIIVDNISTLVRSGQENVAEDWLPIQEWALQLRAKGKSVLFIHHSGKNGNQRGTSRREDVLDTVICLKRPSKYSPSEGARFNVTFEKTRGIWGIDVEPFEAQFQDRIWKTKTVISKTYDKIIELSKEGLSQSDIARQLGVNRSTVSRYLKK
jgi:AAA domain/Homeodomain-like domain